MLALVDCNNFYASCERVFRPDLQKAPIAVLSNNDGCIIARSQEVKDLGIPMGAPMHQYKGLIQNKGVHLFSANFSLYGDLSSRVMNVLKLHCKTVEVYSIDEAFLDLSEVPSHLLGDYCRDLRAKVLKWTGIPVSIGVAPSKTLAKLANHVAKKHPRSGGCWLLKGNEQQRLSHLDVAEVWGVGRKLAKKLNNHGIHSVWDLRQCETTFARKLASVNMERTVRELRGDSCLEFEPDASPRQRILVSRSFGSEVSSYDAVRASVVTFATRASHKLRHQKSHSNAVSVFIQTNRFKDSIEQYKGYIEVQMGYPTNDPSEIVKACVSGLDKIYKDEHKYKRAGVMLEQLVPEHITQYCLLSSPKEKTQLGSVLDAINSKMGSDSITFASTQIGAGWQMNQNRRSPRYTTRWSDLKTVT